MLFRTTDFTFHFFNFQHLTHSNPPHRMVDKTTCLFALQFPLDFSTDKGLQEWLSPDYVDYEIPGISLKYYGHRQLPTLPLQLHPQSNLFLRMPVLTELCPRRHDQLLHKESFFPQWQLSPYFSWPCPCPCE